MSAVTLNVEHVFVQYGQGLHRYLMQRLMNSQGASDLAQEAFARLLKVKDAELIRAPQAYLYRIASNLIYELRLREQRDPVVFDSRAFESAAERAHNPVAKEPDEQIDLERQLHSMVAQLPPLYPAILVMKKRDGKSLEEIAHELDLSIHTVKKHLFKAVAQCRAYWAQQSEWGGH